MSKPAAVAPVALLVCSGRLLGLARIPDQACGEFRPSPCDGGHRNDPL